MIQRIAITTDFSPESTLAFTHALRLALQFRAKLDLLHVRGPDDNPSWASFPHVRDTLTRWGFLPQGARPEDVAAATGVQVNKINIPSSDAAKGLSRFIASHQPDLLVAATHGRSGLSRMIQGSVTDVVAHKTKTPTLLLGPKAAPFVDAASGDLFMSDVLFPVASHPSSVQPAKDLQYLMTSLPVTIHALHVEDGSRPPPANIHAASLRSLKGNVVDTILSEAKRLHVQVIAMATEGNNGIMDALRGSTTARVLHEAPCPVLAIPANG